MEELLQIVRIKWNKEKEREKYSQCKKKVVSGIEPGTYPYATQ